MEDATFVHSSISSKYFEIGITFFQIDTYSTRHHNHIIYTQPLYNEQDATQHQFFRGVLQVEI